VRESTYTRRTYWCKRPPNTASPPGTTHTLAIATSTVCQSPLTNQNVMTALLHSQVQGVLVAVPSAE
jgi:hypothetical protein